MSEAIAAPASRNAPCPCGSGRRYKECHGQVAARTTAVQVRDRGHPDGLAVRMQEALAAQLARRFDEAIAAYDEVIRAAPDTFDAWHMRGVVHLQAHRFDAAEADMMHALALRPDFPVARKNLALVEGGRRSVLAEERVSRAALPRFAPLVEERAVDVLDGLAPGMRCFIVELGAAEAIVDSLAADAQRRGAVVQRMAIGEDGRLGEANEARLGSAGAGDFVIAAGTGFLLGDWTLECAPHAIALVVDGARLAPVEDRLRELSGQRRRRVRLAATHAAPIDLEPLPHWRMAP